MCKNKKHLCGVIECPQVQERSFGCINPEKAKFWSERNEVSPYEVFNNSHKKYCFDCDKCNHKFNIALGNINRGHWCPYCVSQKLCDDINCQYCFNRSFASHEKAKYWSPNNTFTPRQITQSSGIKCLFTCYCNHVFEITPSNIINGSWCPYCSIPCKKICEEINCKPCFNRSFASHEKAKYWSSNNVLNPRQITKGSDLKYWFKCLDCKHEFDTTISNVIGGHWCPYCVSQKLCKDGNCRSCFDRSFASHEKAKYWSPNNTLTPRQVAISSGKSYLFDCQNCAHSFDSKINNITNNNRWCPYCAIPSRKLCDDNNCQFCFDRSFASDEKAKYWSPNNTFTPRQIMQSSGIKCLFICYTCNHEFDITLGSITRGSWCPYCSIPCKKLCDSDICNFCFDRSFASHEKAKYLSPNNILNPRQIMKGSELKCCFICPDCKQEFNMMISNVTNGQWCPLCVNKTEKKLFQILQLSYPALIRNFRVDWCKNPETTYYLPFDFLLPEYKIIIELDGDQHFKQISNWAPLEQTQARDKYKTDQALANNYSIIRLYQPDVYHDRNDWLDRLLSSIQEIILNNKPNVYLLY